MYQEKGLYRPYAKLMKETVDVPVICAGRMDDPNMALKALENCETDIIPFVDLKKSLQSETE